MYTRPQFSIKTPNTSIKDKTPSFLSESPRCSVFTCTLSTSSIISVFPFCWLVFDFPSMQTGRDPLVWSCAAPSQSSDLACQHQDDGYQEYKTHIGILYGFSLILTLCMKERDRKEQKSTSVEIKDFHYQSSVLKRLSLLKSKNNNKKIF